MSEIKVNNGNIEDALKRFKRQCARNGVIQEVRKREHYEKPSVRRKKKKSLKTKLDWKLKSKINTWKLPIFIGDLRNVPKSPKSPFKVLKKCIY